MKKLFVFLAFIALVASVDAQRGKVLTVTASEADSSKGTETDYQVLGINFTDTYQLTIQSKCTQLGGTSDGKITLEASGDGTNYFPFTATNCTDCRWSNWSGSTLTSNDTLTITNGAVWSVSIPKTYEYKYRTKIVGTSGDTTLIITKYIYK